MIPPVQINQLRGAQDPLTPAKQPPKINRERKPIAIEREQLRGIRRVLFPDPNEPPKGASQ